MKEGAGCHLLIESVGLTHAQWLSRGSCSRSNSNLFPSKAQGKGWDPGSPFQPKLKITFLKSGRYVFSQPYTPRKTCFPQTKTKLPPLHQSSLNREINAPVIIMFTVLPPAQVRIQRKWTSTWKVFEVNGENTRFFRNWAVGLGYQGTGGKVFTYFLTS